MKRTPRLPALLLGACTWMAACLAQAAEPLRSVPVAPAVRADAELPRLLRAALADFGQKLPAVTLLRWTDIRQEPGGPVIEEGHWSPAVQAFDRACSAAAEDCRRLVRAQLLHMTRALQEATGAPPAVATAATASAAVHLCGAYILLVEGCFGFESQLLLQAGMGWLALGREALALEYLARYETRRSEHLQWLARRGEAPGQAVQAAFPELPWWLQATMAEWQGRYADARGQWVLDLHADILARRPAPQLRIALHALARLSWRLGDEVQGHLWEEALAEAGREGQGAPCLELPFDWRMAIARSVAEGRPLPDPQARLDTALQADCGFSQPLFEHAVAALLAAPADAGLVALLDRGLRACGDACAPERLRRLQVLRALASGRADELQDIAAGLRTQLARSGGRMDDDLQLAWAAATVLARQPATHAAAARLYADLQSMLLAASRVDRDDSRASLRNRLRYEGLHRAAVQAALQEGAALTVGQVESLRAQTLLRRLRVQAHAEELAHVDEPQARQRHDGLLRRLQEFRRQGQAVAGEAAQAPALARALFQATVELADDTEAMAQLVLLEALARRKLADQDPREAERAAFFGGALARLEPHAWEETDRLLDSLQPDEAYLSWLQVPGGYLATVLWTPRDGLPAQGRPAGLLSPHWILHRSIPLGDEEQQTVALLRTLMLEGGGALRGMRRAQAAAPGPLLRAGGQPVWRTSRGNFVAAATAPAGAQPAQSLAQVSQRVYQLLLQPLEAQWGRARRLVISPDGPLSQLPFEALAADGRLLVERLEVSYVQSLAVHAELKRRAAVRAQQATAVLSVADPVYGAPAAPGPGAAPVRWQPLPGTRAEAQAVREVFGGATLLTGAQATRDRVLQLGTQGELARYGLLHFATHGYVDEQRSALVLSGDGPQAYLQDGDIGALRLQSRLVVLSACDTGLGRRQSGEGVVGLPYAFMLAGNVNTLMSLWPIDDEATARFIPAFLARAKAGQDLVQALNETKREFAAGRHGARYADPRVWAAFVQYGVPLRLVP